MAEDLQDPSATWGRVNLEGDTATRKAGLSAREEAKRALREAPIRSMLGRVLGVHTDERAWRRGAIGEEEVARRLAKLPSEIWTVVHDIPIAENGANIDHVVVGPPGVFTINTKHLTGKVWVAERALLHNGHKTDYLRKARAEARKASSLVSASVSRAVDVQPVVVVMGAELTIKAQPADVLVVARRQLRTCLEHLPANTPQAELSELSRAVRLPSTWRPKSPDRRNSSHCGQLSRPSEKSGLTVNPWNRYGKRRLYVNDPAGTTVGFYDLDARSLTVRNGGRRTDIEAVIAVHLRKDPEGG